MKGLLLALAFVLVLPACSSTSPTDAPIISSFSADALTIKGGTFAVLRWDVVGGDSTTVRIDPQVGNVPSTGSVSLVLTSTTTFTLTARAKSGSSSQRVLTVIVTP